MSFNELNSVEHYIVHQLTGVNQGLKMLKLRSSVTHKIPLVRVIKY